MRAASKLYILESVRACVNAVRCETSFKLGRHDSNEKISGLMLSEILEKSCEDVAKTFAKAVTEEYKAFIDDILEVYQNEKEEIDET